MTSTSRDDQAAFKPIMEEVGKAPSATASTVPMDSNDDSNEDWFIDFVMDEWNEPNSLHEEIKIQSQLPTSMKETPSSSSPTKPSIPLPSIDTSQLSIIVPLIFVLKTNLAKLEEELHRKNGGQMKQSLEVLLARLDCSNLDLVIESLDTLNRILSEDFVYSYEPYLKGPVDRIVLLCAKQYRIFFTHYMNRLKTVELDTKNPKQVDRIQKFLEENTKVLRNLLVVDHSKHGAYVSREALHELMHSIVPYLVGIDSRPCIQNPFHGILFYKVSHMAEDLFCGYDSEADNYWDENVPANPSGLVVKAVALRLLRDFILDSYTTKDMAVKEKANQSIDALTKLVKTYLYDFYPEDDINVTKHLSAVVYEIYSIFELSSEMKSSPPDNNNMKVLEKLKSYICSIFTSFGEEVAWSHFEMVDKELTVAGRDPREVALFKYLAGEGYARSSQSEVEVVKDTSDSKVPEQTEFAEIQQQQDPKGNPEKVPQEVASEEEVLEKVVPEELVPETNVFSTVEVQVQVQQQELDVEVKNISADTNSSLRTETFAKVITDALNPIGAATATPADTIDSGSDSDVVILDLDDDGNENGHQIVLKPTKIAVPKPIEEPKVVEPSTSSAEERESFEFLNAPEQKIPEMVKNLLVSSLETLETIQESSTKETSTTSVDSSSTSSISTQSKEGNQEIYAEVQKLHQDLAKSQQMLSELLHKLAIMQNIN